MFAACVFKALFIEKDKKREEAFWGFTKRSVDSWERL